MEGHDTALRQGAVRPSRGQPTPAGKNTHSCLHTHARTHTRVHMCMHTCARGHRFHGCTVHELDLLRPSHPAAFQPRVPPQNESPWAADPSLHSEAQQLARSPPLAGPQTSGHTEVPTHTSHTLRQNVPSLCV